MPPNAPPVNIESGFFYYNCPRSRQEVDVLSERLLTYKRASSKAPLLPGQVLAVTNYMVSYHDPPSPGTRELPLLIRKGTAHFMTIPQLVLQTPIHVGDGKWSQVWKGIMTSKDFPDVPPAPVVVKLFQESYLSSWPSIGDFWGKFDGAEWLPGARMAANEAWAYDRMRALQGKFFTFRRTVPWSYGFCKGVLPTGETIFGHVMELISGPTTCAMTADELGLNETGIFNFGDALGMAIHKMHQCGVGHGDLKGDNVIIYFNSANQECDVVLLDFALCMAFEPPTDQALIVKWDIARALGMMEYARTWFRSRLELSLPYGGTLTKLDRQGWLEEVSKEEIPEYKMPYVTLMWGGRKAREGLFNWGSEELQPGEVDTVTDEAGLYDEEGWPRLPDEDLAWGCGNATEGLSAWCTDELQQAREVDTAPDVPSGLWWCEFE
ncbi:hypothetical protein JB92DRAFT_2962039, partial [Gautieria morchelliformis]